MITNMLVVGFPFTRVTFLLPMPPAPPLIFDCKAVFYSSPTSTLPCLCVFLTWLTHLLSPPSPTVGLKHSFTNYPTSRDHILKYWGLKHKTTYLFGSG